MATRRTRRMTGPDLNTTSPARAIAVAEELRHECSVLLELYRKKESFTADDLVVDGRLVSVAPPSSQLDNRDKLWRLHSALVHCHSLMDRAIIKEEVELDNGKKGEYETQRKIVKDRLWLLLVNTGELLKAMDGTTAVVPSMDGLELVGPTTVFEIKVWVYRIFKEVEYWTKTTITTLQVMPSEMNKDRVRATRVRSMRSVRSRR
ncbi:uncharacterized protein V6R79_023308 [Siganus canaliculatus]